MGTCENNEEGVTEESVCAAVSNEISISERSKSSAGPNVLSASSTTESGVQRLAESAASANVRVRESCGGCTENVTEDTVTFSTAVPQPVNVVFLPTLVAEIDFHPSNTSRKRSLPTRFGSPSAVMVIRPGVLVSIL